MVSSNLPMNDVWPCPECNREIYADADRCPYCGNYVTPGRGSMASPGWIRPMAAVMIVVIVVVWVARCG